MVAVFVVPADLSMKMKVISVVLAAFWTRLGQIFLNMLCIVEPLLGMQLLTGQDRGFLLSKSIVTTTIKMDAPDDLSQFSKRVLSHFLQFKRCRCHIVSIGKDYFFREETDSKCLSKMVAVTGECMD